VRKVSACFLIMAAALALAAAIGATGASAVTLCKENQKKCPGGQGYAKETVFSLKLATGAEVSFANGIFAARCLASTFESKTKEESGSPLQGTIPAFSLGAPECEGCKKITAPAVPYSTEFQEVKGVWTLTVKNGGGGNPRFRLTECPPGGKEECTYGGSYGLEFTGGKPASVVANKVMLPRLAGSALGCGDSVTWSASYQIVEATEPGQKGVTSPPVWPSEMP
jgi:hypothetical protein